MPYERSREEEIFLAAIDLETQEERRAYVDRACAQDDALRARVLDLLAADEDGEELEVASDSADDAVRHGLLGTQIGPYKLLQELGEGGMGVVYMAEQKTPVKRRVALKIIKPGSSTRAVIARFEAERQALAMMDHPNIARVLEAGTTSEELTGAGPGFPSDAVAGRPYFVMELVRGVPITRYCDEKQLPLRARIGLCVEVCHAVQHAHQKGIIHRDLKPSNVLVAEYDERPVPKVIDFGVAKAMDQELVQRTLFTRFGELVGTLEYMSPEQAKLNQLDVDTRSDIYSLGVLLYELITGTAPIDRQRLRSSAFDELLRVIREEEPPKPSTKLGSAATLASIASDRRSDATRLPRAVRGPLDAIVMKALEKDRSRRYQTANDLARDLERFLNDEPVEASPPSTVYRLRSFVRRNRRAVAAAATILLLLVAGIVGTTIGLLREHRARATADLRSRQLEKGIAILGSVFEDLDPHAEEKEGRPLRAILAERLDRAANELKGNAIGEPLVVAGVQERLGRTYLGLGYYAQAEALFAKALATRSATLGEEAPETLASMRDRALALRNLGDYAEAIPLFERVLDVQKRRLGEDSPETLDTINLLAWTYGLAGRRNEGIALLERARDVEAKRLEPDDPLTIETLSVLGGLYAGAERATEAIPLLERVRDARVKEYGLGHPMTLAAFNNLANAYQNGHQMRKALELWEKARDEIVPKLGENHPETLVVLDDLSWMYRAFGRTAEAIELGERVRAARALLLGPYHPATIHTLDNLALAYEAAGELEKSLPLFQQAAAGLAKLEYADSEADRVLRDYCYCLERSQRYDEAETWWRKLVSLEKGATGPTSSEYAEDLKSYCRNLLERHELTAAEPVLRECLQLLQKRHPQAWMTFDTQSLLGGTLLSLGKYGEAEQLLIAAYGGMKRLVSEPRAHFDPRPRQKRTRETLQQLIQLYEASNRPAEAEKWRLELEEAGKP